MIEPGTPCVSLWQPYASLIALSVKHIETRSWRAPDSLIGQTIGIHAAQRKPIPGRDPMFIGDFHIAQGGTWLHGPDVDMPMPFGAVVATAVLLDCVPMVADRSNGAHLLVTDDALWVAEPVKYEHHEAWASEPLQEAWRCDNQRPYGDFAPGRWAWLMGSICPLATPVPAKGRQRIWRWEEPAC